MNKLAIVILNWNGRKFLKKFLPILLENTPDWAKVVVADNGSTDDSLSVLANDFPTVEVIVNDANYGFAGGYNQALSKVEAQYYCLLNSDIEVKSGWIDGIIDYMDTHEQVGICQPKLLAYHDKISFEYAGGAGGFIDKLGYPFCRGRIFDSIEKDEGQYDQTTEIFWATGACLFVRSSLYWQLGGLDEDFFAHMEEIDFCWRAKLAGTQVMYYPHSVVYHIGGGTLPPKSSQKTFLNFRNNMLLLYKNLAPQKIAIVFFCRFWLDIAASIRFLSGSGWGEFWAVYKARFSFYRLRKSCKAKRMQTPLAEVTQIYQRSIVFDYYIRKLNKFSLLNKKDFKN